MSLPETAFQPGFQVLQPWLSWSLLLKAASFSGASSASDGGRHLTEFSKEFLITFFPSGGREKGLKSGKKISFVIETYSGDSS